MPSLSKVLADNNAYKWAYLPVALFVGGTSGIGRGTAQAFAKATKGNAHIIICGRDRSAAESLIASFPKPTSQDAKHEFIQCDVTRMKNVQAATSSLLSRLPKLNYLVITCGFMAFRGRDETEEGIDTKLAVHYYGRWKFINDLSPLLQKAKESGEDSKVLTVLGAGMGGKVDVDDLGLKKNFSVTAAGLQAPSYNDIMIKSLAKRYPGIAFVHTTPGVVRTSIFQQSHWALRPINPVLTVLFYPFSRSASECGENMLWSLLQSEAGANRRNEKGDDIGDSRYYGSEEIEAKLWEHTEEEMKRALAS
ncbi:unnamed protein product [Somion occarium]|uniref:NAD(P)-binding protein n=1 Tax=Somion occarium TaxID=3059160 RepID=A0ABP1DFK1_9APHY